MDLDALATFEAGIVKPDSLTAEVLRLVMYKLVMVMYLGS
jgi:hypothetical protein